MRAVVVAGTHSGSGKTTVALGLMAAFRQRGLAVQPFKAGPDFIDAGLHRLAAARVSRNLDLWMCGPDYVQASLAKHSAGADIAIIEGVMGLYDGDRSTASLAGLLQVPVVLVVDAFGMAESAGAVVKGFADHALQSDDSGLTFAGVIFNRVASESHYQRLRNSVTAMPVLGYFPREAVFEIPHRHLGLTTAEERPLAEANFKTLADTVFRSIDLETIAASARPDTSVREAAAGRQPGENRSRSAIRLAVAYDKAFNFYYEDNLDLLRDAGAEIVRFSPLTDPEVPKGTDAVYIGGGYPELHAEALSRNRPMRESIRAFAEEGKPVYAECGGLMYLSREIRSDSDTSHPMAGVFPFTTRMLKRPRLGYREVVLNEDCIVGKRGDSCRGHEFHYSEFVDAPVGGTYRVSDSRGKPLPTEGFRHKNTLASYVHLHFGSNSRIGKRFAEFIQGERNA